MTLNVLFDFRSLKKQIRNEQYTRISMKKEKKTQKPLLTL